MQKRNISVLAVALVLSFGLCACAGSDSDTVAMGTVVETEVEESVAEEGKEAADVETTEIGIEENVEDSDLETGDFFSYYFTITIP